MLFHFQRVSRYVIESANAILLAEGQELVTLAQRREESPRNREIAMTDYKRRARAHRSAVEKKITSDAQRHGEIRPIVRRMRREFLLRRGGTFYDVAARCTKRGDFGARVFLRARPAAGRFYLAQRLVREHG